MNAPIRRPVSAFLASLLLVTSCGPLPRELKRDLQPPAHRPPTEAKAVYLLAHMRDGRAIVLDAWTVNDSARTVSGQGRVLDANRVLISEGPVIVEIDQVALFETNDVRVPVDAVVMRGITVVVGAALGIVLVGAIVFAIACAADPKCFGSCPTFYAWNGHEMKLQAEGFSASVVPSLEATDVDALTRAVPRGRMLEIVMKNEAAETHVVRFAHVLAVPRRPGLRAFAATDGSFREARRMLPLLRATAAEGDVAGTLAAFDGRERTSLADSTDLAARETIELAFDGPEDGDLGLVLASRQSLLTSFLFYGGLASLGPSAVAWLATLERGAPGSFAQAEGLGDAVGGIEVQMRDRTEHWRTVAEVHETGPLATDQRVVPLPRTPSPRSPFEVRLRMAKGAWRVNYVALAQLGDGVRPIRIAPEEVYHTEHAVHSEHGQRVDDDARARLTDTTRTLVTLPGDTYTLRYRLPEHPERYELFLESRGYYLEWIREQWLTTADPGRAAMMGLRPREALRMLAPEYARIESEFEKSFWGNRHAGP